MSINQLDTHTSSGNNKKNKVRNKTHTYDAVPLGTLAGWCLKLKGPKTDPCGTPQLTFLLSQYAMSY